MQGHEEWTVLIATLHSLAEHSPAFLQSAPKGRGMFGKGIGKKVEI